MSLILGLGSNIGERKNNLTTAKNLLSNHFHIICESQIFESHPVDYTQQDHFLNQVIEFKTPLDADPKNVLQIIQKIEQTMGRVKIINKGPRNIDIDILFFDNLRIKTNDLEIPHPSWSTRAFVVLPLRQLPYYNQNKNYIDQMTNADLTQAWPFQENKN